MRIFEIGLILANLLLLLPLQRDLKKQANSVRFWGVGGNLLILFLHGIFEGYRWQMAFSYGFVALFAAVSLIKTSRRFQYVRTPGALKAAAIFLMLVLLGLTCFVTTAFPVFTLPEPTGIHASGVQYFHLVDEAREDPFLAPGTRKRELMVKMYFPAEDEQSKPFARYFRGSPKLIRMFAAFYNMPSFLFDHFRLVKTHSKEGLLLAEQQARYPVVLFSHGAGTTLEVHTAQCEDLASHGYIVVAIDHPYVSAATIFPDHVVWHQEATTDFHTAEPAEVITQIMADDVKFVIDMLEEMNAGGFASSFQGRIDLDRIGVTGHSVGGAMAYNLAINDRRVKAAINLDGTVFVTPRGDSSGFAPFLMLANDRYHIQAIENRMPLMKKFEEMPKEEQESMLWMYGSEEAYQEAYSKALQNMLGLTEVLEVSGNLYTIQGSDHMKFSDIGLFIGVRPLRELVGIGGDTDPARSLEITEALTRSFFDLHLKGKSSGELETLLIRFPEMRKVDLK